MKHEMQPNRWSCSVTSAAMVMGITTTELITKIGHDGSDILFPDNQPPCCFRGFDISEIVDAAVELGWAMTPIDAWPSATPNGLDVYDVYPECQLKERMDYYLDRYDGIAYGKRLQSVQDNWHVVAWSKDERVWHDPSGGVWQRDKPSIQLAKLWIFQKSEAWHSNMVLQSLISKGD